MKRFFNFHLLEFALLALFRRGAKNSFIFLILTALIFLLSTVLLISSAMKHELTQTLDDLPDIIIQKIEAGKQVNIPIHRVDTLLEMEGVHSAVSRIWGYYYFKSAGVNFSVVGIDAFEKNYKESLQHLVNHQEMNTIKKEQGMIIGAGVKKILQENHYQDFFHFVTHEGSLQRVPIMGVFDAQTGLSSHDLILLPKSLAYTIFGMNKMEATDIVVHVANPKEISKIVQKISEHYPDTRVLTKNDIRVSYHNLFDYKSGFFLALFVMSAFTFFIIIYDKVSGLHSDEKKEIGLLRALGWRSDTILRERFYESFIVSFVAYLLGITFSIAYVFLLDAPLIRNIFMGYSELKPPFHLSFYMESSMFILLFLLTVPIYIAAILIPTWKASTLDADEVMR